MPVITLPTQAHPLSNQKQRELFFIQEDHFTWNLLSPSSFYFLIETYQSLILYYDINIDPTKEYFIHKMQNLMVAATSILIDNKNEVDSFLTTIDDFKDHQNLKMRQLDFDISLKKSDESSPFSAVNYLIERHKLISKKIVFFIDKSIKEQRAVFSNKFEQRKQKQVSRSMLGFSFNRENLGRVKEKSLMETHDLQNQTHVPS